MSGGRIVAAPNTPSKNTQDPLPLFFLLICCNFFFSRYFFLFSFVSFCKKKKEFATCRSKNVSPDGDHRRFISARSNEHRKIRAGFRIWGKKIRCKYEARPSKRSLIKTTQALPFVKFCYQHYLIKKLIKKLFTVSYYLLISSFPFWWIKSLLIRVITFPNWYTKQDGAFTAFFSSSSIKIDRSMVNDTMMSSWELSRGPSVSEAAGLPLEPQQLP